MKDTEGYGLAKHAYVEIADPPLRKPAAQRIGLFTSRSRRLAAEKLEAARLAHQTGAFNECGRAFEEPPPAWKQRESRRNVFYASVTFLAISASIIIGLAVGLRSSSFEVKARCDGPHPNSMMQCLCSGEIQIETTPVFSRRYTKLRDFLIQEQRIPGDFNGTIQSCSPINQALVHIANASDIGNLVGEVPLTPVDTFIEIINNKSNPLFIADFQLTQLFTLLVVFIELGGVGNINGTTWANNTNWGAYEISTCGWYGISCSTRGRVQSFSLPRNGLTGSIPTEIALLESLRTLDLGGNLGMTGTLPEELGNLQNLRSLRLDKLLISGTIPSSLFTLEVLGKILSLSLYIYIYTVYIIHIGDIFSDNFIY